MNAQTRPTRKIEPIISLSYDYLTATDRRSEILVTRQGKKVKVPLLMLPRGTHLKPDGGMIPLPLGFVLANETLRKSLRL